MESKESEDGKKEESKELKPQPFVGGQPRKGIHDVIGRKPPGSEFRPMKRGGCGLRR